MSFFLSLNLWAQSFSPCSVSDRMDEKRIALENFIREKKSEIPSAGSAILTVPVVFHVVYHTAAENIPDAQITSQLDYSGKDYRRQNADTINTPSAFSGLAADAQIEFCLASSDPSGNSTNGITRTLTDSLTFVAFPGSTDPMKHTATGGIDAWDTQKYLNIWIVNLSNASGYASNPAQHGTPNDGIVMSHNSISNIHLLSHEIGHYLNLIHVYGNEIPNCQTTDGGDQVSDTPDQAESVHMCPTFPQTDSCTTAAPGIMFMNFMDQTNSTCQNLFTQGQTTRMRDVLNTQRASLLTSAGCIPTGINKQGISKDFFIFPNPSRGDVHFDYAVKEGEIATITIFDISGRIVLYSRLDKNKFHQAIPSSALAAGIFIFRIDTGRSELIHGKFIKVGDPN